MDVGDEGVRIRVPLPEEYSRVTNPERFRPLVDHALALCARLRATYDVVESATFDLLPDMRQPFPHARPPVTLTPASSSAAPIGFAFTGFPSVVLRFGRWHAQEFPWCGCDACNANATDEARRLDAYVKTVVDGRYAEELRRRWFRSARLYQRFTQGDATEGPFGGGWSTIRRETARALRGSGRIEWQPWPRRDA